MPITPFGFSAPRTIRFGSGEFAGAGKVVTSDLGSKRPLIVCGKSRRFTSELVNQISETASEHDMPAILPVSREPDMDLVSDGARIAREQGTDAVIAVGGGSVIDAGKAIAALATNGGELLYYLEVVGKGMPLERDPLPMLAIPTTAGTGSEVTKNAVIALPDRRVKVSLRDDRMIPDRIIIDPRLCVELPAEITAATGMDALTQLIEPWVSPMANAVTDGFCTTGIPLAANALRRAYSDGNDLDSREEMALASLMGGLALANAKLGAVHGFAGPLGGMYGIAHGTLCAALLPSVVEINYAALNAAGGREPTYAKAISRYGQLARMICGDREASVPDLVRFLFDLRSDLSIPGLGTLGVDRGEISVIIQKAQKASSMKGNPIALSSEDLREILERSW